MKQRPMMRMIHLTHRERFNLSFGERFGLLLDTEWMTKRTTNKNAPKKALTIFIPIALVSAR